jgi:predicted TIM-barrel fold metal-dependent hydrolase
VKVFDGHLHTFRFKVPVRESINLFKRQFERFNVEKMSFLALPCDPIPGRLAWDKTDLLDNIRVIYFKSVFSPNGYAYAGLEYKDLDLTDKNAVAQDLLRQVQLYKKVGYDGMKMFEGHPNHRKLLGYPLYDEIFDLYFDYCEKEGFPIIMHLSNPAYMWEEDKVNDYWKSRGCFFDETYLPFDEFHNEILKRMEKNPKLKLTLAHWGFLTYAKAKAERFMSFENTMLDLCPGGESYFEMYKDIPYWTAFIEKYADRITYGTDSYNFEYDTEENWIKATGNRPNFARNFFFTNEEFDYFGRMCKGFGVNKEICEKIFYKNLCKRLGEPKAINYDYFIERCEKLLEKVNPESLDRYNLWCMKNDFESMKKGTFAYDRKF